MKTLVKYAAAWLAVLLLDYATAPRPALTS